MQLPILLTLTLFSLAGCAGAPVHYYSLQNGETVAVSPPATTDASQRIGVGSVTVPKLLNRPQLVVRLSPSELVFEEEHQWGGRLQEELTQLLTSELQRLHPQQDVYVYPAENRATPSRQWSVDIQQLDGILGGKVQLQAQCRLFDKNTRQTLFERNVSLRQVMTSNSVADYVDTQRSLVQQLAQACGW